MEATGETVGEAKWKALRELERSAPGLDRSTVRYQVVSEGERGLLGVGYTPAHVIASAEAPGEQAPREPIDEIAGRARMRVRSSSTSSRRSASVRASMSRRPTRRSSSRAAAATSGC